MTNIKTNWDLLTSPYICGLLAENPSKLSQTMHNSGFKELRLPFQYYPFKVSNLKNALVAMRELRIRGYSVTIPFKENCIQYLDIINPIAKEIGAVNTIINDGKQLHGINTDWIGIVNALKESISSFDNMSCLLIGAGGAAKAAIYALKHLNIENITIVNRTSTKAINLASSYCISHIESIDLFNDSLKNYNLIINSCPAKHIDFFPYQSLNQNHFVFDMITSETDLTKIAKTNNCITIFGISMLLYQGIEQFRQFTEKEAPTNVLKSSLNEIYF